MSSLTQLRFGDVCWHVRADLANVLFDSQGLRLPHWRQSGQACIVKQGPHRTVYRVQLEDRTLYVKHYHVPTVSALVSQWTRRSRGRRELERMQQVADSAIPTTNPVALGEQRKAGFVFENYLITEGIEGVVSLDRFVQEILPNLSAERQGRIRRRLAESLADLVAQLHEAGVLHPDLHSGNVLVRMHGPHSGDAIELFLIDLQEARLGGRADWRRSREDLLAFGLFFLTTARRVDRSRFLRRYIERRPALGLDWKAEANRLQQALHKKALQFWRKLDFRCVTNNRRFLYRNIETAHGFAVTELGGATLCALLREPNAPFRSTAAEVLKDSASSDVVRLPMAVDSVVTPVIYKRFNCPKRFDALRATLHHSPALRAWHAGHGLLIRRIPTPKPFAVIERFSGPFVRQNYLITQAIPDSVNLKDYLIETVPGLNPPARRSCIRWLIRQLGQIVRHMHERNISHRDMKASNFLIAPSGGCAEPKAIYLIDLAGVQIWRRLPESRRQQNLSRILVSLASSGTFTRSDFLRLLFAYDPPLRRNRARWKEVWRGLQAQAVRKIARNNERMRPVA